MWDEVHYEDDDIWMSWNCINKRVLAQRREGDDALIVWIFNVAIGNLDEDEGGHLVQYIPLICFRCMRKYNILSSQNEHIEYLRSSLLHYPLRHGYLKVLFSYAPKSFPRNSELSS